MTSSNAGRIRVSLSSKQKLGIFESLAIVCSTCSGKLLAFLLSFYELHHWKIINLMHPQETHVRKNEKRDAPRLDMRAQEINFRCKYFF